MAIARTWQKIFLRHGVPTSCEVPRKSCANGYDRTYGFLEWSKDLR